MSADQGSGDADAGRSVRRRQVLTGLGGASVAGIAGAVLPASPAAAAPTWANVTLTLRDVVAPARPAITGVSTTAQFHHDTTNGLVYIQFRCRFTASYVAPGNNNFWGFGDITAAGLPQPASGTPSNVIGGSVTAYPSGLAGFAPGGHEVLVCGFQGNEIFFAHGSTAPGVTTCYLNRNSPYTWTTPVQPDQPADVKGTIFYRAA